MPDDLLIDLDGPAPAATPPPTGRTRWFALFAAAVFAVAIGLWWFQRSPGPDAAPARDTASNDLALGGLGGESNSYRDSSGDLVGFAYVSVSNVSLQPIRFIVESSTTQSDGLRITGGGVVGDPGQTGPDGEPDRTDWPPTLDVAPHTRAFLVVSFVQTCRGVRLTATIAGELVQGARHDTFTYDIDMVDDLSTQKLPTC